MPEKAYISRKIIGKHSLWNEASLSAFNVQNMFLPKEKPPASVLYAVGVASCGI